MHCKLQEKLHRVTGPLKGLYEYVTKKRHMNLYLTADVSFEVWSLIKSLIAPSSLSSKPYIQNNCIKIWTFIASDDKP